MLKRLTRLVVTVALLVAGSVAPWQSTSATMTRPVFQARKPSTLSGLKKAPVKLKGNRAKAKAKFRKTTATSSQLKKAFLDELLKGSGR